MVQYTNKHGLSQPVVDFLIHDDYDKGDSHRSCTQLINAPRPVILQRVHDDEIEMDVSELSFIALGKALHKALEEFASGDYHPEERLFDEIEGWKISGQIDLQHNPDGTVTLYDYKCSGVYSTIFEKPEYEQQLNVYAYLVRKMKGLDVRELNVCVIVRDWKKREFLNKKDYPPSIVEMPIPLWDSETQEEYVRERVRIHQEAEFEYISGGDLPYCTDQERWKKPSKWAVKKPKVKRAKKLFDNFEDAQRYADDHKEKLVVEERPSEATRCLMYCLAAPFCDQWQEEQENEQKGESSK